MSLSLRQLQSDFAVRGKPYLGLSASRGLLVAEKLNQFTLHFQLDFVLSGLRCTRCHADDARGCRFAWFD